MKDRTSDVISIEIETERHLYKIKEKESIDDIDQQLIGNEELHLGKFITFLVDGTKEMNEAKQLKKVHLNVDHIIRITYLENFDWTIWGASLFFFANNTQNQNLL